MHQNHGADRVCLQIPILSAVLDSHRRPAQNASTSAHLTVSASAASQGQISQANSHLPSPSISKQSCQRVALTAVIRASSCTSILSAMTPAQKARAENFDFMTLQCSTLLNGRTLRRHIVADQRAMHPSLTPQKLRKFQSCAAPTSTSRKVTSACVYRTLQPCQAIRVRRAGGDGSGAGLLPSSPLARTAVASFGCSMPHCLRYWRPRPHR